MGVIRVLLESVEKWALRRQWLINEESIVEIAFFRNGKWDFYEKWEGQS